MKHIDRIIFSTISVGIWILLITASINKPTYALYIDASDVNGLESYIEDVIDDCRVSGEVYVYEVSGSEGYGEITSARISC